MNGLEEAMDNCIENDMLFRREMKGKKVCKLFNWNNTPRCPYLQREKVHYHKPVGDRMLFDEKYLCGYKENGK